MKVHCSDSDGKDKHDDDTGHKDGLKTENVGKVAVTEIKELFKEAGGIFVAAGDRVVNLLCGSGDRRSVVRNVLIDRDSECCFSLPVSLSFVLRLRE